ncbi:MAG TPA: AMP-binding protein, partial [Gemmata sp.]|nr:AMP-binding protein [Gemmata sp.]
MSDSHLNVASHLVRMAAEQPSQVAIYFPSRGVKPEGKSDHAGITYAELNADVDAIAHGLVANGITRGARTALMVPPSPDFFAITFALFKIAAVPILIDPGMGIRNL